MRCYQFFQTKSCELRKIFLAGLVTGLIASAQLPLYADIAMIAYLTLFSIGWVRSSGSASHAKKIQNRFMFKAAHGLDAFGKMLLTLHIILRFTKVINI